MASPVVELVTFNGDAVVRYDVNEVQIAELRENCAGMTVDTPKAYEEVRLAIANLRKTRVAIEKRRVELKADALAYGRKVDSEAKRFTDLLVSIEDPLSAKKQAVDDEKALVKAEAEAEKLRALEAEIHANRERQEAEARAVREAEEARLVAERAALEAERQQLAEERLIADDAAKAELAAAEDRLRVEREELDAERRRLEEAQRAERERARLAREAEEARLRAEREANERERLRLAAEREAAERAEAERLARIHAEEEAAAKAERDRQAEEERQAWLQVFRTDLDKLASFSASIRKVSAPKSLKSQEARAIVANALAQLEGVARLVDAEAERAA